MHTQNGGRRSKYITRRRIHVHTLFVVASISTYNDKGGGNIAAREQLSVVLAPEERTLLLMFKDVALSDALLAFPALQLLATRVGINVFFEIRGLIERKITSLNRANKWLFAGVHTQVIENVLNLLEELAATGVIAREHGSDSVRESVGALKL